MIAKTEKEIMEQYKDEDYVTKVVAAARQNGRMFKDPIAPNDPAKTTHMVACEIS